MGIDDLKVRISNIEHRLDHSKGLSKQCIIEVDERVNTAITGLKESIAVNNESLLKGFKLELIEAIKQSSMEIKDTISEGTNQKFEVLKEEIHSRIDNIVQTQSLGRRIFFKSVEIGGILIAAVVGCIAIINHLAGIGG